MKLSELVKSKKEEHGLKWADFQEAGIHAQTYDNVLHDKQKSMKPVTMEKLARVLKCSIGEIQACLAEMPNPLRKEATQQEGVHKKVAIKQDVVKKVMEEKPYVAPEPEPDPEEPAEVFRPEPEEEVDVMFPVETAAEETLAEFKARMAYMCLRKFAEYKDSDEAKIFIAEAVLEELLK